MDIIDALHSSKTVKFGWFTYQSGLEGPYYFDLRSISTSPEAFNVLLFEYSQKIKNITSGNPLIVGVPSAGTIFATGLAYKYGFSHVLIEKNDPKLSSQLFLRNEAFADNFIPKDAFEFRKPLLVGLGQGVGFAIVAGLQNNYPSAIVRADKKTYGLGRQIEADLSLLIENHIDGVIYLKPDFLSNAENEKVFNFVKSYIKNSNTNLPVKYLSFTTNGLYGTSIRDKFKTDKFTEIVIVEDLFTTGDSSIKTFNLIKQYLTEMGNINIPIKVIGLIDREEGANINFKKENIEAFSVFTVRELADQMLSKNLISDEQNKKIHQYIKERRKQIGLE